MSQEWSLSQTFVLTLFLTFSTTSYAQVCGPPNCKCVYGTTGLGIECSGPATSFDWKTLQSNAVTLTLNGFDLGSSALPIRPFFTLRELRINNCTNVPAVLKPALANNLPNLQLLDVSSNSLTTIPSNVLLMMTSLKTLDLSANQITALPSFKGVTQLADIMIGQNLLTSLSCTTFQGLPNLAMIDLSEIPLKAIPGCLFAGLTSLIKVSVTRTEITTFPPGAFKDLTALQYLILTHNHLSTLPTGTFASLQNLIQLSLTGNYLTEIPDLTGLSKLQFLNLDDNLFSIIPDGAFGVLPLVKELDLRRQSLLTMVSSNAFTGLPALARLALEDCIRLETLPEDVFAPLSASLKMLFLSSNGMSTIKESWLDSLPNLFWLTFSNNPLICDCNLEWLSTAYTAKTYTWSQGWPGDWTSDNSFLSPKCYLPPKLRGKILPELKSTDFTCSTPEVIPVVEQTVTLSEDGVAHLQALVKGEYPKTAWEGPGGKKTNPVPWTNLLPYPWNLTVLPSPSALKPPTAFNASNPTWWRNLIPKPFDAFLPPLIPLPDNSDASAPKMAEAASPFTYAPPPFPFKSFIPPPFPYKDFIPTPFQDYPSAFPYNQFMPGGANPGSALPMMAEAASPFTFPFNSFIPPPFPYKEFIPAPFKSFIPPQFPYAKFVPSSVDSPVDSPFLWVPPPGKMSVEASTGSSAKTPPWLMFLPPPLRDILPMFPNISLTAQAVPGGEDLKSSELPAPWMMFIPAPFRTFIPILPNGSFPVPPILPGDDPFKAEAAGTNSAGDSKLPAPWMMLIPAPFRAFIPILPNGSFPVLESPPGAPTSPFKMQEVDHSGSKNGAKPKLPAPWLAFVPEPFRFIIPILPNGSFLAAPSLQPISMTDASAVDADTSVPAAPWMMFIPEPFRTFIPILPNGSFPFAKPATPAEPGTPFFPFKVAEATGDGSSDLPAPWLMFIPEPFRTFIPILPNGSFPFAKPATPAEPRTPFFPFKMAEAATDGSEKLAAPWIMFIPEPYRTFIPILPNGSFPFAKPVTPAEPGKSFFPFKMAEAGVDGSSDLPAPWMMFIPEPFRTFIPILPNGSFPFTKPSTPAEPAAPFFPFKMAEASADGLDTDPKSGSAAIPPSAWMNFIPEPFKVFIPVLPNGLFPAAALPAFGAAAVGSPFPWNSLIPEPFRAFVPILPKNGSPPNAGPNDPLMWIAPSAATLPIPVFANGSFPWPPKPAVNPGTNPWLPYPLNETFKIPDFATPWLQYNPLPSITPVAVPTNPSNDPSDWLNIIPNPFKYFIPRLPNGSFPWPPTPADKTLTATEARQPDGSVLASLSATEPGTYTLLVKNGAKTTAYSFNVKKASSEGRTAGVAVVTIAGMAIVVLAIALIIRRLRTNPKRRGFNHLLSESAGQFSYSTI